MDFNELAQGGNQDCNHAGFEHTGCTAAHVGQQIGGGNLAGNQHDHRTGQDACNKDDENIDADNAACKNHKIGEDLQQAVILGEGSCVSGGPGGQKNQHHGGQRSGEGDAKVAPELIFHGAALAVTGCDGGIGDEGEVVTEHGTAHHGTDAQGSRKACRMGDLHSDGGQQGNGADAGTHGGGNEAGNHENHNYRKPGGNQIQHEISNALGGAAAHDTHKCACGHEDQQHGNDVFVTNTLAHDLQFLIEGERMVLQTGGADGNEEGNNNRDIIESHGNVHAIFKQQAKSQIDYQKDGNRQQRDGISFFHGSFS